jgi:hypothetical protein
VLRLDAVGFCGVDDTVDLAKLRELSEAHPWIEWGVLLRPDKEGQPRYAGKEVMHRVGALAKSGSIRIAAHLCGDTCLRALAGDVQHIRSLRDVLGFKRIQVNATLNGGGVSRQSWDATEAAAGLRSIANALPDLEIILQLHADTELLFQALFRSKDIAPPPNLAVLFDNSLGFGIAPTSWQQPLQGLHCGYAGGFGPDDMSTGLASLAISCEGYAAPVWIDMESKIRGRGAGGSDILDLGRCQAVAEAVLASAHVVMQVCP